MGSDRFKAARLCQDFRKRLAKHHPTTCANDGTGREYVLAYAWRLDDAH